MLRVEDVMGTAVRVDVRDDAPDTAVEAAVDATSGWLHHVDATFSTYRPDSDLSRYRRAEIPLAAADPDLASVLRRCDDLRHATDGDFDHHPGTALVDPSGLVKGWAVDRAVDLLLAAGACRFLVDAGGPEPGRPRRVGIRHPGDRGAVCAVLAVEHSAVATSGRYERGEHLWGGREPSGRLSTTAVAPTLRLADALATAAHVQPAWPPRWLPRFPGVELLVVDEDLMRWTPGLDGLLTQRPADDEPVA